MHINIRFVSKHEVRGTRRGVRGAMMLLLLSWLLCFSHAPAEAHNTGRYTPQRPLIIVGDWDFPPYEFNNDNGDPAGFDIDVLHTILSQMHIPHEFLMKDWAQAMSLFERHQADLIIDPVFHYRSAPYYNSRNILNSYKIKLATRTDMPDVKDIGQLSPTDQVVIRTGDVSAQELLAGIAPELKTTFHSPNDALAGIFSGRYDYFLWGEEPLKWVMKELNLPNIKLTDVNIPVGETHFVGYDKELIDGIDDQYSRLEQNGRIGQIRDKWLHPERIHNDTSPVAVYITLGILLVAIGVMLANRLIRIRVKAAIRKNQEIGSMMLQALSLGKYSVLEYDVKTRRFTNRHGHILPEEGATIEDMRQHLHPNELANIRDKFYSLLNTKSDPIEMDIMWRPFEQDKDATELTDGNSWQYLRGHAMTEQDNDDRTRFVIFTMKYYTKTVREERHTSELGNRYTNIFDTSLIAMSFYDKNGWLIDLNQKMRELCEFDEEGERYFRSTSIFDTPYFHGLLEPQTKEQLHVCQHMYYPELGIDKYIELKLYPVLEDNGEVVYYTITARNVTEERNLNMEQRQHDRKMQEANRQIMAYEQQLRYLLEKSRMWVWRSDMKSRTMVISRSLLNDEYTFTFDEYTTLINPEQLPSTMKAFNNLNGIDDNLNVTVLFDHTPVTNSRLWCTTFGIPLHDSKGNFIGHFGVGRDVTDLMETQEKLRRETARAEDSGKLKSMFLANMTHEIRTPLNAIVGFSDLLQIIEEPTDRHEFIRIIRNNCDMLIRLIDDIIEASNMSHGSIAIEPTDVDFAVVFNDICQTLSQRVQEPGVSFIADSPYDSFPTRLDKGRMQQVITNFTTNAVKYTREGHIRVGYRYISEEELPQPTTITPKHPSPRKGIYMYCEDTGSGIPKDKQASVFERFVKLNDYVQGTGLGLSICKNIADRCNGHIGVTSEGEGHGSTFWIWIPCEQQSTPPNS